MAFFLLCHMLRLTTSHDEQTVYHQVCTLENNLALIGHAGTPPTVEQRIGYAKYQIHLEYEVYGAESYWVVWMTL